MSRLVNIKRGLRLFVRREQGTQMIEFAIALPFMLLMFAGTAELGRLFYQYTTLAKATRAGARYLSSNRDAASSQVLSEARNLMVCGRTSACDGASVVTNFGTANIEITPPPAGLADTKYVTVTITGYTYQPLVFDLAEMTGDPNLSLSVPLSPSTRMRYMP